MPHFDPRDFAGRVILAPMSGVTDPPFRSVAEAMGAFATVCEMTASDGLATGRDEAVRKARPSGSDRPFIVQLAGRETHWMEEGARSATDLGADLIDINMGCPARKVTNGLSGSALMRNLDHAERLIDATLRGSGVPVGLKMRLGWDREALNAPDLAERAEAAGVTWLTVHGRTRQQFYKGHADWAAVARVKQATALPLIVNGDVTDVETAREALRLSGADAVMVGRAATGRPWLVRMIEDAWRTGRAAHAPDAAAREASAQRLLELSLEHYGPDLGVRAVRKHLAAAIDAEPSSVTPHRRSALRRMVCTSPTPQSTRTAVATAFEALAADPRCMQAA